MIISVSTPKHAGAQDERLQSMLMKSQITPVSIRSIAGRLRAGGQWLRQHFLLTIAAPLGLALATAWTMYYFKSGCFVVSTDDAYVQADSTIVASRVSGYVSAVLVQDDQPVRAGEVLARIDDRDFRVGLGQAQADVQAARSEVADLHAQLTQQDTLIARARASVAASGAALDLASLNRVRFRQMASIGFGSQQQSQEADAQARERAADLARDQAALATAQEQVHVLQAKLAQAQALEDRAQAIAQRAALDLGYTTIIAPIDGVVAARTVRLGQYVQAGTQLTALVPLREVYVTANFKETQLTRVRAGEPVRLRVDTFPGAQVRGCVDSLAPASGLEFSLLPPDNATGNFTKIVQRIPVKIVLDGRQTLIGSLRPGMSVEASIDTKPGVGSSPPAACVSPSVSSLAMSSSPRAH
jgi:membrane fusion protein, multidrug efflux system